MQMAASSGGQHVAACFLSGGIEEAFWAHKMGLAAFSFGLVLGWITKQGTMRKDFSMDKLSAAVAAIGGGAVCAHFPNPNWFADYCLGLAFAFFALTLAAGGDPDTGRLFFQPFWRRFKRSAK